MTKQYLLKREKPLKKTKIDYQGQLNPEQFQVVTEAEGPCLVLAGAGSGKTRTLTYRVSYLLEKGIRPENVLLVTFTNKAAHEMVNRTGILLGAKPRGLWAGTFHHIANRSLRIYAEEIGYTPNFTILDEEDSRTLIRSVMASLNIKSGPRRFPLPRVVNALVSFSVNSNKKIEDVVFEKYPYLVEYLDDLKKIAQLYHYRKKTTDSMDFDDLLVNWIELIRKSNKARERFTKQFQYILVDEYQDTNYLQYVIIKELAQHHRNLLVVGDDAQSIYSFRAANLRNLLDFPKDFPECSIYKLETNYRSSPEILGLANEIIKHNQDQFPKVLKASRKDNLTPNVVEAQDLYQQASFCAQRILELRDDGLALNDIAVLFRSRFQVAEVELEMTKRNIPYVVRGGVRFFEQAHIKDVLSYLRVVDNPKDELAWLRILEMQPGIGQVTAAKIAKDMINGKKNPEKLPNRMQAPWNALRKILDGISKAELKNDPSGIIKEVLERTYVDYARKVFENAQDRIEDLNQLVNFAHPYDKLATFIHDISLRESFRGESNQEGKPEDDEYLVLSTIHQSKGLEWKAVFVIGVSDNYFPHSKSMTDLASLEEERRLFYVATTRAKDHLYISYPMLQYDSKWGDVIARPSMFIQELPSSVYEKWQVGEGVNSLTDEDFLEEIELD